MSLNHTSPGFGFTAEYVPPGIPWVTGSVALTTTPLHIHLPRVSKYVDVLNVSGSNARVGFTAAGVDGVNYFRVQSGTVQRFDVRVADVFVRSDSNTCTVDVVAGLTLIERQVAPVLTGSIWEGVG